MIIVTLLTVGSVFLNRLEILKKEGLMGELVRIVRDKEADFTKHPSKSLEVDFKTA